jgi:hypothetical protein
MPGRFAGRLIAEAVVGMQVAAAAYMLYPK